MNRAGKNYVSITMCVQKYPWTHRGSSNVGHDCTTKDLPETSFCATCLPFDSSFIVPTMQHQVCLLSKWACTKDDHLGREGPKMFEKNSFKNPSKKALC